MSDNKWLRSIGGVCVSLQRQLEAARQRIEELEKKLGGPGVATPAKIDKPFSMRAEEKRQRDRKQNKRKLSRRGRLTSADKLKRTEACYPEGVAIKDCWFSHARPVWRLEQGRAVLVAYQIFRGPGGRAGRRGFGVVCWPVVVGVAAA